MAEIVRCGLSSALRTRSVMAARSIRIASAPSDDEVEPLEDLVVVIDASSTRMSASIPLSTLMPSSVSLMRIDLFRAARSAHRARGRQVERRLE